MTLKDKFGELYVDNTLAEECEKIADEFAIEFAEWIALTDYRHYSNGWSKVWEKGTKTSKELLEIYKKQKGL
jgi:hypothetical protein